MPRATRTFLSDPRGFTGAERALVAVFALAVILLGAALVRRGGERAAGDARRTLEAGGGAVSAGALGGVLGGAGPIQATGSSAQAGQAGEAPPGAVAAPAGPAPLRDGLSDDKYDGAYVGADGKAYRRGTPLDQVPPVLPKGRPDTGETILYVNGISNTKDQQAQSLQAIADKTGARVIGIHNSTGGMATDILQCIGDKIDLGHNAAVEQVTDTLYDKIKKGETVHIMGHSQGALILSRGLYDLKNRLMVEDGLSKEEAERLMGHIQVETFGGAADSYPDGPQYVHYVNRLDLVPATFGLGPTEKTVSVPVTPLGPFGPKVDVPSWGIGDANKGAGRGAKVIRFNQKDDFHDFNGTYLDHRRPFDEARR